MARIMSAIDHRLAAIFLVLYSELSAQAFCLRRFLGSAELKRLIALPTSECTTDFLLFSAVL